MMVVSPFKWTAFNYFGYFCAYGVLVPFLPVWLKHHGYSTETIGLLAAIGYLFRFCGSMLASQRVKQVGQLIPTARYLTWFNLLAALLLAFSGENFWLLFPVLMLFQIFNSGAMPIADSIASIWQRQNGLDYGKARLFGSIAFVVGSLSAGYLIGVFGQDVVVWVIIGFLALLGLGQLASPTVGFEEKTATATGSSITYLQLLREPETLRVMIAVSLISASHAAYYTYSTIHWSSAGISTQMTSLLWGLAVAAEILFFLVCKRLFKSWKISHLMILSAVFAIIRWATMASTTAILPMMMAQILHSVTFGASHIAVIRYISMQSAERVTKLQGLYFGLASCAVMAVFTFVAGILYQSSPSLTFYLMAAFVVPAIFIMPKKFEVQITR
ncbi:MFS transporter [Mannheimia granulomatis]|uniref:MFS transporter n=1 Tax=Mannheimia granulomatis TaxID=85402 RepID=A0A011M105_9PAST|nr:3-phenylpropionate MFS transporter [Mannheimia granulomatis]EXI63193.1 MFS transporter [Mannheimia granulomatis]RGE49016.1 MFS transporter [Mannheimia granulomatis]